MGIDVVDGDGTADPLRGVLAECCGSSQGHAAVVCRMPMQVAALARLLLAAVMLGTGSAARKFACTGADGSWRTAAGAAIDCMNISYAREPACAAVIHIAGMLRTSPSRWHLLHAVRGN